MTVGSAAPGIRFDELLAVENTPEILSFRCPESDTLLWPAIRQAFLRFIIGDLLYSSDITPAYGRRPFSRALAATLRTLTHNALNRNLTGDVLIMGTGMGTVWRDARLFNRISDYFAEATPGGAVLVEDLYDWNWPRPRWNERVLYHTPIQLEAFVRERVAVRGAHETIARRFVNFLRARASIVGWSLSDGRASFLCLKLARYMAQSVARKRAYHRLLRRVQPRVVLKEEASYGHSALFNLAVREAGVPLAEHQHGMVSSAHDAYNVAPALLQDAGYRATQPDWFLSYGEWWTDQINAPCQPVAIGSPHRTRRLRELEETARVPATVLLLGDGFDTDGTTAMSRTLAGILSERYRVVFRPHPMERAKVKAIYGNRRGEPFVVDEHTDIYDSMRDAAVVVGEFSTGLVESAGIVDRVFVWQTPRSLFFFPHHPFAVCESADDLARRIMSSDEGRVSEKALDRIWQSGWEARYAAFLSTVGASSS
jgi:hypothetical protein